ncbi:UvrABC system protein C [Candidatus Tiddalikarchaeum anstoanum]|nr:UvrABC system protein C [Candidatus Tiddalikarchaeum anstoanum]
MIKLDSIPKKPGCYLFKDNNNAVIYVGKAKNLQKRVSQYFQKKDLDIKTQSLVKNIESMDFIMTNNETEAFILENRLIKENKPKYNINLRDSKTYAYISVTNDNFPRLVIARKKEEGLQCFGPFVSGFERESLLTLLRRIFMIRTCNKLPKKACLRYYLKLCSAPCINNVSKEEYEKQVFNAVRVLKGNISSLIKILKLEMSKYSDNKDFERAIPIRDRIRSLESLNNKQNVERNKNYDEDIINYVEKNNEIYIAVFNILHGTLINKKEFEFDNNIDNFIEEFILEYYSENVIPLEIILPYPVSESLILALREKNKKVKVVVPKIGEKKDLLLLVKKNIEASFFGDVEKVEELRKILDLKELPVVIECFDISNLANSFIVGSMVQFRNGKPDKSNYRRFKIKTVIGADDFRAMYEVVFRRYSRLSAENLPLPDLVVIDGGSEQLKFAMSALNKIGLHLPIIALAKREEDIYLPNKENPLIIDKKNKGLQLLQGLRDEAHRFAIKYNKLLRSKDVLK